MCILTKKNQIDELGYDKKQKLIWSQYILKGGICR